ncbi:MAG: PepSY-like domain-containing protein [Spirosomataceae bacterium]
MKNQFVLLSLFVSLFVFSSCEDDKVVPETNLPAAATEFISTYYGNQQIIQTVQDFDDLLLSSTYQVTLSNLTRLEFTKKGEIIEIEGSTTIPTGAIPASIVDKAQELFPTASVIGWELEDRKQEAYLSNQVSLKFDRNGVFLRIDD